MTEQFANFASSTLAQSISAGATSLDVSDAASFPATGDFRIAIDREIFLVTNVSGVTFTVTPGYEGTTQALHASGSPVRSVLTAGVMQAAYPAGRRITSLTGTLTMAATDGVIVMALGTPAAYTIAPPSSPIPFKRYGVKDGSGNASSYPLTLSGTFDGTVNPLIATDYFMQSFYWDGTAWRFA